MWYNLIKVWVELFADKAKKTRATTVPILLMVVSSPKRNKFSEDRGSLSRIAFLLLVETNRQ
jgi:hypothetical protein